MDEICIPLCVQSFQWLKFNSFFPCEHKVLLHMHDPSCRSLFYSMGNRSEELPSNAVGFGKYQGWSLERGP